MDDDLQNAEARLDWGKALLPKPSDIPVTVKKAKKPSKQRATVSMSVPDRAGNPQTATSILCVGDTFTFTHTITFDYAGQSFSVPLAFDFKLDEIQ